MRVPRKLCAVCGREITWRKKWQRTWEQVKYCGEKCRRTKLTEVDRALEVAILELLDERAKGATICPSEAARRVEPEDWQPLMERWRQAARRLIAAEKVEMLQRGKVVDASRAQGAVRLRRV